MPRITKRIYGFEESINEYMIYCTSKDLTKKIMKSYKRTLKLFAKYLADEINIFTPVEITQVRKEGNGKLECHCNDYKLKSENKS